MELKLETPLKKFQRREYYRLECAIEASVTMINEDELEHFNKTGKLPEELEMPEEKGVIIDISGGGMKFVGCGFKTGDRVYIEFDYMLGAAKQSLKVTAQIIDSVHPHDRKDIFHNRASFINIKNDDREALIRFIFEEERKRMQLERRM